MGKASGSLDRRVCPCGKLSRNAGRDSSGNTRWGVLCSGCHSAYKKDKVLYCQRPGCGFIAEHSVQIHIDHKDGNKHNNKDENLWSLCANCHALKTYVNEEWTNRYAI
jgi:predicted HNH restriction endonuclease